MMFKGLRLLAVGRLLLREVRGLRREQQLQREASERIAAAMESYNRQAFPPPRPQTSPDDPAVAVSYVDNEQSQEFMDIELGLTAATGQPPTEEEVLQEFLRRHTGESAAQGDGR